MWRTRTRRHTFQVSIYATFLSIGDQYPESSPSPCAYEGSHILVDPHTSERRGELLLCQVPQHVIDNRVRAGGEARGDAGGSAGGSIGEVVRLTVGDGTSHVTVLLDRQHVHEIRDALNSWLSGDARW